VARDEAAMREYRHFEARKEQRPMKKRRVSSPAVPQPPPKTSSTRAIDSAGCGAWSGTERVARRSSVEIQEETQRRAGLQVQSISSLRRDLGLEPDALVAAVAERLVRRLSAAAKVDRILRQLKGDTL
jgi:hypothetical protein